MNEIHAREFCPQCGWHAIIWKDESQGIGKPLIKHQRCLQCGWEQSGSFGTLMGYVEVET